MMNRTDIANAIEELKSANTNRISKYRRNLRKYSNTPGINIDSFTSDMTIVGYTQSDASWADTSLPSPNINVIKSIIDTLTSKIAQSKVRPFFNTMNGSYKDMQVALQSQHFFDLFFENEKVHSTVSEAFRDACIYDTGAVYIDELTDTIHKALPWQVYTRPAETTYGKHTRVYYERKTYPVSLIPEHIRRKFRNRTVEYTDYGIYYDIFNHIKAYTVAGKLIEVENFDYDTLPFCFLHYTDPNTGNTSLSVVDILYTIQTQIDMIVGKISTATELTPANTVFVPEGSSIKAGQLNNGVGNILTYKPTPNMTQSPVTIATPSFIDAQYSAILDQYIQRAYELVGISQLSAMSSKPQGLDSGVALSTMENIESDRFETQLKQVISLYVDIARKCIDLFEDSKDILPATERRLSITWGDIKKAEKSMSIQFSAADSLSKDPSVKIQQLQTLAQAGIIPASRIASLMELPDIQSGYSLANNAVNAVYAVIDDCLAKDIYTFPDYIPFTMLKEEIINVQLSLKAANKEANQKDIDKLKRLYTLVEEREQSFMMTAEAQAHQAAMQEQGQQMNILEQEANISQQGSGPNLEHRSFNKDLDMSTTDNQNGRWNGIHSISQQS